MPLHALVLTLLGGVAVGLAADWIASPPVKARRRMAALRSRVADAHRRRVRRMAGALRLRRRAADRRTTALAAAAGGSR
ncbi:MAG TPA: hypothetical protein VFJ82_21480 [Longimicrobium sp.]|nr:hypothetical protein [Longimicrobium sp.]